MIYQLMEIQLMLNVEPVPQVTAYHDTAEAQVLSLLQVLKTHAAQRIHVTVYKSFCGPPAYLPL